MGRKEIWSGFSGWSGTAYTFQQSGHKERENQSFLKSAGLYYWPQNDPITEYFFFFQRQVRQVGVVLYPAPHHLSTPQFLKILSLGFCLKEKKLKVQHNGIYLFLNLKRLLLLKQNWLRLRREKVKVFSVFLCTGRDSEDSWSHRLLRWAGGRHTLACCSHWVLEWAGTCKGKPRTRRWSQGGVDRQAGDLAFLCFSKLLGKKMR